jgi:hypothetical protein
MEIALSREGLSPCRRRQPVAREVHAEGPTARAAPRSRQPGASDAGGPDPKYAKGVRPPGRAHSLGAGLWSTVARLSIARSS